LKEDSFEVDFARSWGDSYQQVNNVTWDVWGKRGVLYTDGREATAEDVKFDVDRLRGFLSYPATKWQWIYGAIESVQVVEPFHLRFHLSKPVPWLPQILHFFQPEKEDNINRLGDDYDTHYPGTGPWMITSWTRDQQIVLEPNPYYFGEKPLVDKMVMKFYSDASTLRLALERGDVDLVERGLLMTDYLDFRNNANLKATIVYGNPAMRYFTINKATVPQAQDVRVREAIARAINRTEITTVVYKSMADEAWSYLPKPFGSAAVDTFSRYPFNLTRAKELMTEAGYATGFGPIELWYSTEYMGAMERDLAVVYADQLSKIGITLTPVDKDQATFLARTWDGTCPGATSNKWTWDWPDPDDDLNVPCPGRTNVAIGAGWIEQDAVLTDLQNRERASTDQTERLQIFKDMQNRLTDLITVVPVFDMPDYLWMRKNVTGLKPAYSGADYFFGFTGVYVK
jgi:peptide/nickel transport system substrate-binding protein